MRLGVLDVGSNTVHLLVVDAHRGGHPMPTHSRKTVLRLAELVDARGNLSAAGARSLVDAVAEARREAADLGCDDMLGFATSAVRDARNSAAVLERVKAKTGVQLGVLSGQDEARLTFLAVRRWFGWSAGRLTCLDIGGGSLELANGIDEEPDVAISLPLGAGRLTRAYFPTGNHGRGAVQELQAYVRSTLAEAAPRIRAAGRPDRAVATSKTLRTLARLTGAAPSKEGPRVQRLLTLTALRQLIEFVSRIEPDDLSEIDGVSAGRAHQLLAGAIVARETMEALGLEVVEICPWALREGVILRRLDWLDGA